jgi:hypothetical protein
MRGSALIQRELVVASRRLMIALRLVRRMTGLRAERCAHGALPSAMECRRLIADRSAAYLAVLSRYNTALEKAVESRTGSRVSLSYPKRRYTAGAERT